MTEDEARAWIQERWDVSRETGLARFVDLLREEAGRQNLIAPSTLDHIWARHIVDSAQLIPAARAASGSWLDIGSGAGLPGLVLAILRDEPVELMNFRRQFGLGKYVRGGSEDLGELKRLILTGAAIGFLPTCIVEEEVRRRELWPLLSYRPLPGYPVYLVTRPAKTRPLPAQLLLDEARRRLTAKKGE